jgi:hypothetical protein
MENVHFLTWGSHHASNAYSHVRRVILAGTLFYRISRYEALRRASGNLSIGEEAYDGEQDERAFRVSESSHAVLQALCRGAVRKAQGDGCPPSHAYIVADRWTGLPHELPSIFPGCTVKPWRPLGVSLSGKPKAAVDYLMNQTEQLQSGLVRFKDVADAVGLTPSNFTKNVRKHPDFMAFLAEQDITETANLNEEFSKVHPQARYFTSRYYYWFGPELPDDSDMPFDPMLETE